MEEGRKQPSVCQQESSCHGAHRIAVKTVDEPHHDSVEGEKKSQSVPCAISFLQSLYICEGMQMCCLVMHIRVLSL